MAIEKNVIGVTDQKVRACANILSLLRQKLSL